ncbi:Plastid lipid-associated protein chloroplastic-like [Melia azedarach]|uniref:Plastid lipid-associated protein chloroplastic-like n=2 Tax=Melia azedarach TaxID=155640 RepID=A0ACC1YYP4_MELAZ|nr:Plastid lipid-associated protein chloroplastic-like [Melia azedarach]KAJ4728596.1 Plastid lipid-associated protein chloroplastic-like [Melia azedarach]
MALLFSSPSPTSFFCSSFKNPNPKPLLFFSSKTPSSVSFSVTHSTPSKFLRLRCHSSSSPDPIPEPDSEPVETPVTITDEWGEKTEGEADQEPTKLADADPPKDEDEWEEEYVGAGNGRAAAVPEVEEEDKVGDLKRCLVDTVYGTEFGFRVGADVRAEVTELVNLLEALNPTPNPMEATGVLDGNWVLVYTAFSELLPLLAVGATPFLKVEKITQKIDTSSLTIVNSTTFSSPFADFSFSASASFEVRSPSRIQVQFKEGTLQPPEIKSNIDLPENLNVFGQNINMSPVQQSLSPVQEAVASIARTISGQPPLKVPIPGERTSSWLLITYLDEDLRISRGDGGLFVLVKEGSPLLDQ